MSGLSKNMSFVHVPLGDGVPPADEIGPVAELPMMDPVLKDDENVDSPDESSRVKRKAKKKKDSTGFRKAPQAPKRFKSPYIIFSMSKMEEYKNELGKSYGKVTSISRRVAEAWRNLSAEERKVWDEHARQDKLRYIAEKSLYTGPWLISSKRTRKDPSAPKRPMSAFLFYSQGMRQKLKKENPDLKNTEISCLLGKRWKTATTEERRPHREREEKEREAYKKNISEWRAKKDEDEKAMRRRREDIAGQFVKSGLFQQGYNQPWTPLMNQQGMPNQEVAMMPVYNGAVVSEATGGSMTMNQVPVAVATAPVMPSEYAPQHYMNDGTNNLVLATEETHHQPQDQAVVNQFHDPPNMSVQGQLQDPNQYQSQLYEYVQVQSPYAAPQDINQAPAHQDTQQYQIQEQQAFPNV